MSKRESGYYRVYIPDADLWDIFFWNGHDWYYGDSLLDETTLGDSHYHAYEMVMGFRGEIVCVQPTLAGLAASERYNTQESRNANEHDPLYNTKQEG